MKKILIAAALSVATATTAIASDLVITTGSKTGSYFKAGQGLKYFLKDGKVVDSNGSVQNLERLSTGEANVGIAQMDAYAWYVGRNPGALNDIESKEVFQSLNLQVN